MAASCRDSLELAEAGRRQGLQGWGIRLRSVTTQPRQVVDSPLSRVEVPNYFSCNPAQNWTNPPNSAFGVLLSGIASLQPQRFRTLESDGGTDSVCH